MTFEAWANANGLAPIQCTPYHVAQYLRQMRQLGGDALWAQLQHISAATGAVGLSDPTLSPLVIQTLDAIAPVPAPRGWTKEQVAAFARMPRDIKLTLTKRARDDERAVRSLQNLNALLKQFPDKCNAVVTALLENEGAIRNAAHKTAAAPAGANATRTN